MNAIIRYILVKVEDSLPAAMLGAGVLWIFISKVNPWLESSGQASFSASWAGTLTLKLFYILLALILTVNLDRLICPRIARFCDDKGPAGLTQADVAWHQMTPVEKYKEAKSFYQTLFIGLCIVLAL